MARTRRQSDSSPDALSRAALAAALDPIITIDAFGTIESASDSVVVLGTRGRTNLRYVLLGSTAERVLAKLPCSALAVKLADLSIDLD